MSQVQHIVEALLARRSSKHFTNTPPTDGHVATIIRAATTVPDHNELHPWRFVVVGGDERAAFGDALVAAGLEATPDLDEARRAKLRSKAFVAPTFVVIIFSPKPGKAEYWEQEASAASTGYAMVLTAHLIGVGAIWKSAPIRAGRSLATLLDMNDDERLMGWVNLGTPAAPPRAHRNPVTLDEVTTRLVAGAPAPWVEGVDDQPGVAQG